MKLRAYAHLSRGLNAADWYKYDLIVGMTQDVFLQLEGLRDLLSTQAARDGTRLPTARVRLLESYGFQGLNGMEERVVGFTEYETDWWVPPARRLGMKSVTGCRYRSRQSVVGLSVDEVWHELECLEFGLVVYDVEALVEEMDVKEWTREKKTLLTLTGPFGGLEDAMRRVAELMPLRKF